MANVPPPTVPAGPGPVTPADIGLYAVTIAVWSVSWICIRYQVGVVPEAVSVFYRFAIAAVLMFAWMAVSRRRIAFPARLHLRFALMGTLMFSANFVLFYTAANWIPTGLLAVIFSLVTVMNPINAALILGERLELRVFLAALIGVGGIALIFLPEISRAEAGPQVLAGLGLAVAGTMCFSLGNMVAGTVQRAGHPVVSTNGWGMAYGALLLAAFALASGEAFVFDPRPAYVISLLALAVFATVIAFAGYLTLMRRIGAGRAAYATVMFPVGALVISWLFEGYQWSPPAVAGLVLALAGNLVVLRR